MIRIVGVQRNEVPEGEFVLLQNQGSMRLNLKGHLVMSQSAVDGADLGSTAHVFSDDVLIPPGMFVVLATGFGEPRWAKTKDQQLVYYAYMGRRQPLWDRCSGAIHVLATQHTFVERAPAVVLR